MKNRLLFLVPIASAALLALAYGQMQVEERAGSTLQVSPAPPGWSTPVNISKTANDSQLPVIAVDGKGKAYVTWVEWWGGVGDRRDMMFTTNAGGAWLPSSGPSLGYVAIDDVGFPTIAVTSSGNLAFQAWHDADYSLARMGIFVRQRVNGTWSTPVNMAGAAIACSYPALATSPIDNTLFLAYMADPSDITVFDLAIRYRDGASGQWSSPEIIPGQTGGSKYLYQVNTFFVDAKGTAHLIYTTHSDVWYTKNPNPKNINTWTAGLNISGGTGLNDTFPKLAVDNDGDAYVVWPNIAGTFFKKTVNGAWQATEDISLTREHCDLPSIAVNPLTKDVYAVWQQELGSSNWEIMLKTFTKTTGQWSAAVNVSNSPGPSGQPSLRSEANGSLHLVYADRLFYPGDQRAEIMYATKEGAAVNSLTLTSPNGGDNWQAGTTHSIAWTTNGTVANVKIEYSYDGGTTGVTVVNSIANTGSYSWAVPITPGTNCLVRISSAADSTISDTSDAPFIISPPPKPKPPLSVGLDTRLDGTGTKKINAVIWQAHPDNAPLPLKNYRIYRKRVGQADSFFAYLAAVSGTTLQYEDSGLEVLQKYVYRVTALSTFDDESDPSATITETKKFEFCPLNLAVQTAFNRILFFRVKINTLAFEKNSLNDEAEVSGYKLYRRKAEEPTTSFTLLTTLSGSTFTHRDGASVSARLAIDQKYAYAVTTIFSDGRESAKAEVMTDK